MNTQPQTTKTAKREPESRVKYSYRDLESRCERLSRSIHNRAWKLAREAGCGCHIHMHNAMIGTRWPEIDYPKLKRANYIMSKQFEPYRLLESLYHRLGHTAFDWS